MADPNEERLLQAGRGAPKYPASKDCWVCNGDGLMDYYGERQYCDCRYLVNPNPPEVSPTPRGQRSTGPRIVVRGERSMKRGSRPGIRPLPKRTIWDKVGDDAQAIWWISAITFVGTMIALPFVGGGLVVFVPYVAWLRESTENVSLYDLLTGPGWYYAVFMAIVGSMSLVVERNTSCFITSTLGALILAALLIGKFS